MKRSEVNVAILEAEEFFARNRFSLPPFALWSSEDWSRVGCFAEQFTRRQLGWDVTDFGSGDFSSVGLTLFTLRNGPAEDRDLDVGYAEKIMLVGQGQLTPFHFHHRKVEDIINRGSPDTGRLIVRLYNSTDAGDLDDSHVVVVRDGVQTRIDGGGEIVLSSGESVTLPPRLYHSFHAVDGPCLVGEISTRNNDVDDNRFLEPLPRFSEILEDVAPLRLLWTEYPVGQRRCSSYPNRERQKTELRPSRTTPLNPR